MRRNAWKPIVGALVVGALLGCRGGKSEPVAAPQKSATPTTPVAVTKPVELPAAAAETESEPTANAQVTASAAAASEPVTEPAAVIYGTERLVLLAPGSPIIIELRLSIDG